METLEHIAVRVKTLRPQDSIGKAAEAIRCSNVGAAPVIEDGRLLGLLTAETLADFLALVPPRGVRGLSVASLALDGAIAFPVGLSPTEAMQFLQGNRLERAVVLDITGGLLGVVTRAELVSALCGRVRPPVIGGMATPFGVYLTGGGVRGGVGDLALMTTGMYLAFLQLAAFALAHHLFGPSGWIYTLPAPAELHNQVSRFGLEPLTYGVFALFFKMSTFITGYHAAEHQVVHTIEAGDDLMPEVVREKSRVHPRCGTNLVAAILIMTVFWKNSNGWFPGLDAETAVLLALFSTFFFWRRIGGLLQQHVTTGPASPRQLQSGIKAGQELMDRFQERPTVRRKAFHRIWNMGLIQVISGSLLVIGGVMLWQWLHLPLPAGLQ
jgi:CBS domain-containing protein